jgi:hypothetical protein
VRCMTQPVNENLDSHHLHHLHFAGFVAITVRRDVLDVNFHGLDSAQPSYTAAIAREASVPAGSSPISGESTRISILCQTATGYVTSSCKIDAKQVTSCYAVLPYISV